MPAAPRALLDVNVLIALLDADHASHAAAMAWFAEHAERGWASCPITQNGCVRIMSHPGYPNAHPVSGVVERLRDATAHRAHTFWPDDASLLDAARVDATRVHGPRQITDAYLLALAVAHGGRLVTFDSAIPLTAVAGAKPKHVVVL
ncbi:MAG TPA: TA system VapC family ribonuclease toxin [Gemmatimonadaceae bacterium]|nr:TA system VapC family ribonuclease toxin [Gemmatimonadaceae bacterium]